LMGLLPKSVLTLTIGATPNIARRRRALAD
jgi:hypothetical protein